MKPVYHILIEFALVFIIGGLVDHIVFPCKCDDEIKPITNDVQVPKIIDTADDAAVVNMGDSFAASHGHK